MTLLDQLRQREHDLEVMKHWIPEAMQVCSNFRVTLHRLGIIKTSETKGN